MLEVTAEVMSAETALINLSEVFFIIVYCVVIIIAPSSRVPCIPSVVNRPGVAEAVL